METLALGTKQYLVVDVADRLSTLSDLDGVVCTFDVVGGENGDKYTAEPASTEPGTMKIRCLIDTADWEATRYYLWVTLLLSPEQPRLGPFEFVVE